MAANLFHVNTYVRKIIPTREKGANYNEHGGEIGAQFPCSKLRGEAWRDPAISINTPRSCETLLDAPNNPRITRGRRRDEPFSRHQDLPRGKSFRLGARSRVVTNTRRRDYFIPNFATETWRGEKPGRSRSRISVSNHAQETLFGTSVPTRHVRISLPWPPWDVTWERSAERHERSRESLVE